MDRVVVSVSPIVLGAGLEAVGDLGHRRITDAVRLVNQCTYVTGDDVLLGGDIDGAGR